MDCWMASCIAECGLFCLGVLVMKLSMMNDDTLRLTPILYTPGGQRCENFLGAAGGIRYVQIVLNFVFVNSHKNAFLRPFN